LQALLEPQLLQAQIRQRCHLKLVQPDSKETGKRCLSVGIITTIQLHHLIADQILLICLQVLLAFLAERIGLIGPTIYSRVQLREKHVAVDEAIEAGLVVWAATGSHLTARNNFGWKTI
jgi:hypothetical protein